MKNINDADWPQILVLDANYAAVSRRKEVEIDNNVRGNLNRDQELLIID